MIKVGVVRGGPSSEYDVSIKTGGNILSHLRGDKLKDRYKAVDIFIDKDGVWHQNGLPTSMEQISNSVNVIFNALHGTYGEDGKIQQLLDQWKVPYTGSSAFASALGFNKVLSKERFGHLNIKTPKYILFPVYQKDIDGPLNKYVDIKARTVIGKISPPWIVKPLTGGSSVGMHLCKTFDELRETFREIVPTGLSIFVEEFIKGKEATVGVIDNFRGQGRYVLPPIEIRVPKSSSFFDYKAKYSGKSEEICPGNFTNEEKEELSKLASIIHEGLGLSHYSRSDFIIDTKGDIYALEVNTLPGLTDESLFPKSLEAVGSNTAEFIDHILKLALKIK